MKVLLGSLLVVFLGLVLPSVAAILLVRWCRNHRRMGELLSSVMPILIPLLCPVALAGAYQLTIGSKFSGIVLIAFAGFLISMFVAVAVIDVEIGKDSKGQCSLPQKKMP